jgi:hypothetical protein
VKAEDVVPKEARGVHQPSTQFIHLIGKLYAAESHAQKKPGWRARLRRRYSAAVLKEIKKLLDHHLETTAPSGKLGEALRYLAGQWPKLIRYVENEAWPIDNNPCHAASGMTGIMPTPGLCRVPRVEDAQSGDAPFAIARLSALSEALQEDKQGIGRFVTRQHNAARIGVRECALLDLHVSM